MKTPEPETITHTTTHTITHTTTLQKAIQDLQFNHAQSVKVDCIFPTGDIKEMTVHGKWIMIDSVFVMRFVPEGGRLEITGL